MSKEMTNFDEVKKLAFELLDYPLLEREDPRKCSHPFTSEWYYFKEAGENLIRYDLRIKDNLDEWKREKIGADINECSSFDDLLDLMKNTYYPDFFITLVEREIISAKDMEHLIRTYWDFIIWDERNKQLPRYKIIRVVDYIKGEALSFLDWLDTIPITNQIKVYRAYQDCTEISTDPYIWYFDDLKAIDHARLSEIQKVKLETLTITKDKVLAYWKSKGKCFVDIRGLDNTVEIETI